MSVHVMMVEAKSTLMFQHLQELPQCARDKMQSFENYFLVNFFAFGCTNRGLIGIRIRYHLRLIYLHC